MSKSNINPKKLLKDIDTVFDIISKFENGEISIEEATKQSNIMKEKLEKYPKNLDSKK
tara:strand:+ start:887 stop:1060 length:174 start_codon:yes stop_codon:yes gene_type:complete